MPLSPQARLGEQIFNDTSLSASGQQACASCHAADRGHGAPNALAAQFGGPTMNTQGTRSSPPIRYLAFNGSFRFAADGIPTGGFFWDGRARSLQDQAGSPFVNPAEMAAGSHADVVARLAQASYAGEFKRVFGADILTRPDDAFERMTLARQQYQLEDTEFRPFSSKYDEFLRGRARLGDAELRGLPLFTDFSYDNLGVPRNPELAANADPNHFDLGLCARPAGDLADRPDLCDAFKVPSLRNVALRGSLFHNGRFKTLKDALAFYVQRDTNPEKFYPVDANGRVNKFDDLPPQYRGNVNTREAPYDRHPGDAPALSDAEIDDVVTFLSTLTDGYAR